MDEKIFYNELIKPDLSKETLAHYGIKGMKWDKQFTRQGGSGIDYNRDKRFTRNYNGINVMPTPDSMGSIRGLSDMYTPTPDFYNDYMSHGLPRGWAKPDHKYITRERGKNGKWKYRYNKGSLSERFKRFGKYTMSKIRKITDKIDKDHDYILDIFDRNIDVKEKPQSRSNDSEIESKSSNKENKTQARTGSTNPRDNIERTYKYYKKIKGPNGKYRYFYSEAEYKRYSERISVLDKDYAFMQDVPVLSSKSSAMDAVKKADVGTDAGNCSSCAMAFELRMRGYDVQSKPDIDGASSDAIRGVFKDGGKYDASYNWYLDITREENSKYYTKDFLGFKKTSEEEQLQIAQKDLERSIIERGGNDQRGFIRISWTKTDPDETGKRNRTGGGHVFNYVVNNGQVKFYDAQKDEINGEMGQEVDIKTYLDNTDYISHSKLSTGGYSTYMGFYRVDNLDIDENIKEYVQYKPVDVHDEAKEVWVRKGRGK